MRKIISTLIAYLFLFQSLAIAANCGGGTPCACGDTVTSSYTLTGDLNCTNAGNGLSLGANDLTIDLGGHTLDGDDVNTVYGIYSNGRTGTVITNGTIQDFTTSGIEFQGASTATVSNVSANSTGNQGFQNIDTSIVTYNNVTANNNADDGMSGHDDVQITINGGTFTGNAQGVNIIENATLVGNDVEINDSTTSDIFLTLGGTVNATFNRLTINNRVGNDELVFLDSGMLTINSGNFYMETDAGKAAVRANGGTLNISGVSMSGVYADPYIYLSNAVGNIKRCKFNRTGTDHIIDVWAGASAFITHNIFHDAMAANMCGIVNRAGGVVYAENNLFYDGGEGKDGKGILFSDDGRARNNIFLSLNICIQRTAGTVLADYNVFYDYTTKISGTVTSTNEILSDPLIWNSGSSDFRLQANSPGIDTGVDLTYENDFGNNEITRKTDIGPYEFRRQYDGPIGD